jgi:hypothetical protein
MVYSEEARLYIGYWENDKKYGIGKEVFQIDEFYEGNYVNGKPHGFGIYHAKEILYEGDWSNGLKHGNGKWTNKNGDCYEGDWS